MTKANMIKEIQNKEATLWMELAAYDNQYAPADGDYDREIEWDLNDDGHCQRVYAWSAVHDLMESLGIKSDFDSAEYQVASELTSELTSELFRRRQAARGIYYDERGNEI